MFIFTGRSKVTFNGNVVSSNFKNLQVGGSIYSNSYCHVSFEENSITTFTNNSADFGATIFSLCTSTVTFKGKSKIVHSNNYARYCGILISALSSRVNFDDTAESYL